MQVCPDFNLIIQARQSQVENRFMLEQCIQRYKEMSIAIDNSIDVEQKRICLSWFYYLESKIKMAITNGYIPCAETPNMEYPPRVAWSDWETKADTTVVSEAIFSAFL